MSALSGNELKALRVMHDKSQRFVARKLGVDVRTVRRWEAKGEREILTRNPVPIARAIVALFDQVHAKNKAG